MDHPTRSTTPVRNRRVTKNRRPREPRGPKIAPGTEHTQRKLVIDASAGYIPTFLTPRRRAADSTCFAHGQGFRSSSRVSLLFGIQFIQTKTERQGPSHVFLPFFSVARNRHPVAPNPSPPICGAIGPTPVRRSTTLPKTPRGFCQFPIRKLEMRFLELFAQAGDEAVGQSKAKVPAVTSPYSTPSNTNFSVMIQPCPFQMDSGNALSA